MLNPVSQPGPAAWSTWSVKRHTQLSSCLTSVKTQMESSRARWVNSIQRMLLRLPIWEKRLNHQHGFMRQNLLAVSFSTQDYQSDPFEGHVSLKAVTYASLCRIKAQPLLISVSVGKENRSELRNKSPRLTVAAVESTLLLWSSNNVFRSFLNPQFPFWISHNLLLAQVRRLCLSKLCTWTFFSVISPPFLFPCRRCYIFLLNVLPLAEVLDACKTATKASLSRRDGFFSPRLNLNSFPLSCCFCWSNWILANEGGF